MREAGSVGRLVLFIVMAVIIAAMVLGSALTLLPPPPGGPTPTAPQVLDRPEGLPRVEP